MGDTADLPIFSELEWGVRDEAGRVRVEDEQTARQLVAAHADQLELVSRSLLAEPWHPRTGSIATPIDDGSSF